jgi:hypothetical protein
MGWHVVSIPFFEWDRLHQTEQRDAYVERRVHLAPTWHNHTALHGTTRTFHTRFLEQSRNTSEDSCPSRSNSIRDASFSFCEGSWESAASGGAVSPHPHKSRCLMPPRSESLWHLAPAASACRSVRGRLWPEPEPQAQY